MKRLISVLFILLFPSYAYALACVSAGSGGWNVAGTWGACGGGVPGAADTVTINAGHVVTIDGNATAGNAPASATTYNIDISGTLYWPNTPGADWTFTARSSIRINAGGILQIADAGTPLNSANRAYFLFDNTPANQKYKIYVNGGKFYVYGNPDYFMTSGTNHRARILQCIPDCNAGAGKTIMLDRAVYWPASASLTHDAILIGIGGNVSTAPAAGDDGELITTWGSPGSSSINGVTFTENHMVGDIVVNVSRNVLFQADSATYHSLVESTATNDPYDINYARFDEFGDNTSTASGITFNNANNTVGTINYTAVTNCEDSAAVTCFYLNSSGWASFEGNTAFDARSSGYGYRFTGTAYPTGTFTAKDCSYVEAANGNATGMDFTSTTFKALCDGFWSSNGATNLNTTSSPTDITNCLLHGSTTYNLYFSDPTSTYLKFVRMNITDNELRNSGSMGAYVYQSANINFKNNDIDGAANSCFQAGGRLVGYFYGNSYNRCNTSNTTLRAGFEVNNLYNFDIYAVNESFGDATANNKANIQIDTPSYTDTVFGSNRYTCNNCSLGATANPTSCSTMPTDGIIIPCTVTYNSVMNISDGEYLTLHNKDQVAGDHVGWGPGGMVISRETGTVVDNTLNVKVVPTNPLDYAYLELGTLNVVQGQTITVNVQLRKTEAQAAGYKPRLALEGAGFDRYTNYDEMSDVNNTWETTTVTGVASYSGSVHVYLGVKNNLSGANAYEPVWPPTIEIFADGISVTKTGP